MGLFPSIDDEITWGKHKGLTYRAAALMQPSWCKWAACNIEGLRGQLCAEALAVALGCV